MKPVTKGRSGGVDGPAFVPSPEWVQAFRAQLTPELLKYAQRYARTQSRKVRLVRVIDDSFATELVQDIVGDTMTGVIAWAPERVSLKKHLLDAIMSRTRHAYVHASKFRPVQLDANLHEAEEKLAQQVDPTVAASEFADEVLKALRRLSADDDRELHLLLEAYDRHVTKRFDVLRLTGLTAKEYDAARHRLHRLTELLPPELSPSKPE